MNQNLTFIVYGQDPDNDPNLSVYITQVPTSGILSQADGTPIRSASTASPVRVTSSEGTLIFTPAPFTWGNVTSVQFYVDDNTHSTNSKSTSVSVPIVLAYVNQPPVVMDINVVIAENGIATVNFNATDPQNFPSMQLFCFLHSINYFYSGIIPNHIFPSQQW